MPIVFEPFAPDWRADPYPIYRQLRERAPVHYAPEANAYCVSRYADVVEVLRDWESYSSEAMSSVLMRADLRGQFKLRYLGVLFRFLNRTRINPLKMARPENLATLDPPRHDDLRKIVTRGFTPRRVAGMEARIKEIVAEKLAGLERGESFDAVRDFAVPVPSTVIAEMLGVETERLGDFKRWSDSIIEVASGSAKANPVESGMLDSLGELFAFVRGVVRERRETGGDDLIATIVDPSHGETMDELEVVQFVILLLVAGNETTTNLIGNAVNLLLDRPDVLVQLEREPGRIPDMLEEVARLDPPVQLVFRRTTRPVELSGTKIPEGGIVVALLAAANRDSERFVDAERFDLDRDTKGHLSYGFGVHFCLGASLARLEAKMALEALIPHLGRLRRTDAEDEWIDSFLVRGRASLPLVAA